MGWTKVSGSRWERPADGLEGYFIAMGNITAGLCDGRQHYTLFSKIKLETTLSDTPSALKHAWKQLRYEQPQIATSVEGMNKVYEVPDEQGLEAWLESTFIISDASDAEDLYQTVTPIKQATMYYVPKSSELLLRAHHYSLDGVGVMLFWHSYLSCLESPVHDIKFGDEPARLAPTMEEVLGYAEQPSPTMAEKAGALFMEWAGSIPGIGPMSQLGAVPAAKCQNTELVFPTKTSEALISVCKEKGISVTAAVHAAYVQTMIKYADPNSKTSQYVTANQFNLRPYLPEPYNSSKYAVSVYYSPIPYKIDLPASYWDVVDSMKEYYGTTFNNHPETLELKGHFTRVLCGAVQTPEFLANPVPKDALVSSLGVVERYVQQEYGSGIKVRDIKIGADIVMGMSMFFFYTFHNQLRLVYSFNDGFEDQQSIQTYLEEIQNILVTELLA